MKLVASFVVLALLSSTHILADDSVDRSTREAKIRAFQQATERTGPLSLGSCPISGTLSCGSTISSTLTTYSCIDTGTNNRAQRWAFQATAGQVIAFELSSAAFTTFLVVDGPGYFLDFGNTISYLPSGVSKQRVDFYVPTTGTYTIEAESLYGPGDPYPSTGPYIVKAICGSQTPPACVNANTLCLLSSRFQVTLVARDQRTGSSGPGLALPTNDLFGYFSIPALTGNPSNPEVFVKILDGRPVNGKFWVFYNGLTDMQFTLVVTDTVGKVSKTYEKAAGVTCGGFDTSAFDDTPNAPWKANK